MRLLRILLVVIAVLGGASCRSSDGGAGSPAPAPATRPADPAAVLHAWDARRARAYAATDTRALRGLYVPGSRAGLHDVRMLRRYAARGLRVVGLRMQLLAVRVVRRRDRHLDLEVTDRVVGGVAVGRGTRVRLPHGAPRRRALSLVRRDAAWLVAEVRLEVGE